MRRTYEKPGFARKGNIAAVAAQEAPLSPMAR